MSADLKSSEHEPKEIKPSLIYFLINRWRKRAGEIGEWEDDLEKQAERDTLILCAKQLEVMIE